MITVRWPRFDSAFPQVEFRRLFRQIRRPVADDAAMVTAYTDGVVTLRSNRRLDGYHEAADMSGMQGVRVGDFVVHGLDILRGSVGVSDADGAMSSVCVVCAPITDAEPRYFAWQIRAQAASGLPRALARGVREGGADFRRWDTLAELPVLCPPPNAQRAIANYLDSETARIDALIAKKQCMIDLFEERRQALITGAVTNENAPRDGGVKTRPLKRYCDGPPQYGLNISAGDYADEGVRLIRTSDIQPDGNLAGTEMAVFVPEAAVESRHRLLAGDILFSRSGTLGKCIRITEAASGMAFAGFLVRFRPDRDVDPRFLEYCAGSKAFSAAVESDAVTSTISNFNAEKYGEVRLPDLEQSAQRAIADYLDKETSRIDAVTVTLERQIKLLREHRQALIANAVTGDLEVPRVAA